MDNATTVSDFDPRAGIILVTATVFGRIKLSTRLVFDTGATHCMLPAQLISALGVSINPRSVVHTTTASSVASSPIVTLPSVEVLGRRVDRSSWIELFKTPLYRD